MNHDFELTRFCAGVKGAKKRARATNGRTQRAEGSPTNAGALRPARSLAPFAAAVKISPAFMAGHRSAPLGAGRGKSGDGGPRPPEPSGDGGPREWRHSSAMRQKGAEQGSAVSNKKGRGSGKRKPPHPQAGGGSGNPPAEDGGLPRLLWLSWSTLQTRKPRLITDGTPKPHGAQSNSGNSTTTAVDDEPSRKALGSRRAPTAVRAWCGQHGRGWVVKWGCGGVPRVGVWGGSPTNTSV